MATVARLLQGKGFEVWSVHPDASAYDAIKLMAEKGIGALPVTDGEALVGMISERDYARKVIVREKMPHSTLVREIMTAHVHTVSLDDSIDNCMALMTEKRIRHLPVLQNSHLIGLISIGDIVKALLSDQELRIHQLESYISGR